MIMNRKINLIVAADVRGVIGKNNAVPWRLRSDMAFFKKITTGNVVLMGRKTFESIGKPLPDRYNIVVTHDTSWSHPNVSVIHDIDEALLEAALIAEDRECEVFVIGGEQIYAQTVHSCDRVYLTRVYTEVDDGDAVFKIPSDIEYLSIETVPVACVEGLDDHEFRIFKFELKQGM
jgi:dihydrofolate reductase